MRGSKTNSGASLPGEPMVETYIDPKFQNTIEVMQDV